MIDLDEKLNTSGSAGSGTSFYFDYQDSQYGYNTSSTRGADTFHPFSVESTVEARTLYKSQGSMNSGSAQQTFTDLEIDHYIVMIVGAGSSKTSPSSCISVYQGVEVIDWWIVYVGGGNYKTACAIFKVTNSTVTLKGDYTFLIEYI